MIFTSQGRLGRSSSGFLCNQSSWHCIQNDTLNVKFHFLIFNLSYVPYHFVLVSGVHTVVSQSYSLQSLLPGTSRNRPAAYTVIAASPTALPVLYFPSPGVFCNCQFALLNPFALFTQRPHTATISPSSMSLLLSCLCCSLDSTYK